MAKVWAAQRDGVHYEVRRDGKTLLLFANGVQHSEYHPDRLLTGSVWDLLWLPALLHSPERYRRVLVLGLGGGSMVPAVRSVLAPDTFVAVEKDALHLEVAEHVFGVADAPQMTLIEADATQWLAAYQGEPFDLIVDDLFAPNNEVVSRAVAADGDWLALLSRHVSDQGMLVMNFGDWQEYQHSDAASSLALEGYASRFRLSCQDCHNAVIAFSREKARSVALRRRVKNVAALASRREQERLDYHIRQLD